jgi:putative DNA primase/helicase
MKDLTGGELIVYRMLFSYQFDEYIPQFKVHIMTNDSPKIDGTDEGVKRRSRVLPYISKFVTSDYEVDQQQ